MFRESRNKFSMGSPGGWFLGAAETVTIEVPGWAVERGSGRGRRGASETAENIVARYQRALSEQGATLPEAV